MSEPEADGAAPWRVLVVCTANMCRSPMAELLLGRHLVEAGGPPVEVSSCGLLDGGREVAPEVASVLASVGLDPSGHRSRRMSAELLLGADLVLAMAREHLREAAVTAPKALGRTFTLKEAVRRGEEEVGPRTEGTALADWVAALGTGRRTSGLLGASELDDVADPMGGPLSAFRDTMAELDDLTGRLARLLVP